MQRYLQYGAQDQTNQSSRLQWTRQEKPNCKSFNLWKKLLTTHFSIETTGRIPGAALGIWITPHHETDRAWQYYTGIDNMELYERHKGVITCRPYIQELRNARRYDRASQSFPHPLPVLTIPVDVTQHGRHLQTNIYRNIGQKSIDTDSHSTDDSEQTYQEILMWAKIQPNWKLQIIKHHSIISPQFGDLLQQPDTDMYILYPTEA